jgi:hypothetical protein
MVDMSTIAVRNAQGDVCGRYQRDAGGLCASCQKCVDSRMRWSGDSCGEWVRHQDQEFFEAVTHDQILIRFIIATARRDPSNEQQS